MAHARSTGSTTRLLIGSCNLDHQSLYRNDELDIRFEGPAIPRLAASVFDELAEASTPAVLPAGRGRRTYERTMARISRLL